MTHASGLQGLAPVTHAFAESDGLRLHALDFGGQGPPLLLLHGVGGHAWMWHEVVRDLAGTCRPIALDLRGYGDSQWSPGRAYSTDQHVRDAAALLDFLGIERVDVAGFSWGGLIGLGLAAREPNRVGHLAMIDIPPSFTQSETEIPRLPGRFEDRRDAIDRKSVV